MRLVIQRVKEARVTVDNEVIGAIGKGLLVFCGVHKNDTPENISWLASKLVSLRIFQDEHGKMNLDVKEVGGQVLIVSQFTLYGNCAEGRRPEFTDAAPPEMALRSYEKLAEDVRNLMGGVQLGLFGAYMEVSMINDGPVTLIIDK